MISIERLKEKTGCSHRLEETADYTFVHYIEGRKPVTLKVDAAPYMEPSYNGPGWLTAVVMPWLEIQCAAKEETRGKK